MSEWGSIVALTYIAAQRVFPDYNEMADAKALLESEMGSGGDDLTYELASKAVEAVKAWSKGPMETRPIQRVAINFRNGKANRGRFDFDGRAGWFR